MAQITLNMKLNSESFTVNDEDIIYMVPLVVSGAVVGSTITAIDTASADTQVLDVEETNAQVIALTDKLVQITLDDRSTPYIAISRIKDLITVNSLAVIKYDGNGNVFQTINTSMTVSQILSAIQTTVSAGNNLSTILVNGNETGANDIILSDGQSISSIADLSINAVENLDLISQTEIIRIYPQHVKFIGLAEYADNAAAITGGLVAGDTYILAATQALTVVV